MNDYARVCFLQRFRGMKTFAAITLLLITGCQGFPDYEVATQETRDGVTVTLAYEFDAMIRTVTHDDVFKAAEAVRKAWVKMTGYSPDACLETVFVEVISDPTFDGYYGASSAVGMTDYAAMDGVHPIYLRESYLLTTPDDAVRLLTHELIHKAEMCLGGSGEHSDPVLWGYREDPSVENLANLLTQ